VLLERKSRLISRLSSQVSHSDAGIYSYLSAVAGSIQLARRAGTAQARSDTPNNDIAAPPIVNGSRG
jgi:hypothetical protein